MENEPFMASLLQSSKVAQAARILTAGCHKNCPAANGHMPEAYPPLTCAPGANGTYWVNVVRQHFYYADDDQKDPSVVLKCEWVPADDLMVAKLATCDKFAAKRAAYVKKEFMCLKQKESQAARPPCSDLETVNTGHLINQLRDVTQGLKRKQLSKEACMSLAKGLLFLASLFPARKHFGFWLRLVLWPRAMANAHGPAVSLDQSEFRNMSPAFFAPRACVCVFLSWH
jgi:hypothetical protein